MLKIGKYIILFGGVLCAGIYLYSYIRRRRSRRVTQGSSALNDEHTAELKEKFESPILQVSSDLNAERTDELKETFKSSSSSFENGVSHATDEKDLDAFDLSSSDGLTENLVIYDDFYDSKYSRSRKETIPKINESEDHSENAKESTERFLLSRDCCDTDMSQTNESVFKNNNHWVKNDDIEENADLSNVGDNIEQYISTSSKDVKKPKESYDGTSQYPEKAQILPDYPKLPSTIESDSKVLMQEEIFINMDDYHPERKDDSTEYIEKSDTINYSTKSEKEDYSEVRPMDKIEEVSNDENNYNDQRDSSPNNVDSTISGILNDVVKRYEKSVEKEKLVENSESATDSSVHFDNADEDCIKDDIQEEKWNVLAMKESHDRLEKSEVATGTLVNSDRMASTTKEVFQKAKENEMDEDCIVPKGISKEELETKESTEKYESVTNVMAAAKPIEDEREERNSEREAENVYVSFAFVDEEGIEENEMHTDKNKENCDQDDDSLLLITSGAKPKKKRMKRKRFESLKNFFRGLSCIKK